jgi:hypothetical protein
MTMIRWVTGIVLFATVTAWITFAATADDKGKTSAKKAPESDGAEKLELARQARTVLQQHCSRCHQGPGSRGSETDILKREDLLGEDRVKPGSPGESYIIERIVNREMPPENETPIPGLEDLSILWRWIEKGAPDFPKDAAKRSFVSIASVMAAAVKHLNDADEKDRSYLRFFTLHNLSNRPGITESDLKVARAALSKAVNSMSRKNRLIVLPRAIDPAQLVFAIDLRDYGWDRADIWLEVEKAYPYAFHYGRSDDDTLRKLDEELDRLLPRAFPILRADWFVATAMRPPLYHVLLQIPENSADLERELGVNIANDFQKPRFDQAAYAGLAKSGVSGQNRQLERHEFDRGGYWISRDFKPGNPKSSLVRFPLGPLNLFPPGHHPFKEQAFAQDGGEIIFPLPNGLQAYMLVKGDGGRIDAGPIDVVSDTLRTSGTPEIVNGISCNTCHKHGMIGFTDVIRESAAVFDQPERRVKDLYAPKKIMDKLIDDDSRRFLAALDKAISPFLRGSEAEEKQTPLEKLPEPISELARAYRVDYLDLAAVAAEHDIEDPGVLAQQVGIAGLKRIGLEGLLKKGGVVSRADWEAVEQGVSLMQKVGEHLRKDSRSRN